LTYEVAIDKKMSFRMTIRHDASQRVSNGEKRGNILSVSMNGVDREG